MTRRADTPLTRTDFHAAMGVLLITREPPPASAPVKGQPALVTGNPEEGVEILIAVWDDGSVTALNGHVDLGTGIRTALAQIVAEELDVGLHQVNMVLGDTTRAPNQGATIASASIQIHAVPLRAAAAQAKAWLLARAAGLLDVDTTMLAVQGGVVSIIGNGVGVSAGDDKTGDKAVSYAALLAGQHTALSLNINTHVKAAADYRVVGTSSARVDIPAKATGTLTFVHDMRVPGMLHGRVVRPPYAGADHGDFIGNTLQSVDESSIAHIPGIRAVVVIRDFVGIVAEREEHAEQALRELQVHWKPWPGLRNLDNLEQAIRNNPSTQRKLIDEGDVDAAIAAAAQPMARNYIWPYQMHGSIGPSCAVAAWKNVPPRSPTTCGSLPPEGAAFRLGSGPAAEHHLTVWAGTQNPHVLRADLSRLMGLPDTAIDVIRMEAAGCYGRNCADDVAADAALLSRAVGQPVRVQLTREQEHAWEPKGAAQLMQVNGGLNADGSVAAYDFQTSYPSNGAPTLALLLTRTIEPTAQAYEMGDRTARPPYDYANLRVAVNDMPPMLRASWLRGVSALPNSFAHESYIDELATAAGVDPVEFRLRYLSEPRAAELIRATADRAGWMAHTHPQQRSGQGDGPDILHGQGVAYARYIHSKWPGFGAAWAAWVADVEVNRKTGEVHVRRVVVGHDAGTLINPAGVQHQIHGNVVQTTSRALLEQVQITPQTNTVASQEWGSYPILNFRDVPVIEVVTMARPGEPSLGAGESASVPGTAAIANAIFDATGVRFRQPPFTPEAVLAGMGVIPPGDAAVSTSPQALPPASTPTRSPAKLLPRGLLPKSVSWWARTGALLAGAFGVVLGLAGWRSAIAPVQLSGATLGSVYSAATLERGRQLAATGNCVVCHTAPGSVPNAGGRAMDTPFGKIISTNITPDAETGIGQWSFSAFQRALREGISRDGHYLYPAMPYTAFAKTSDEDLTALYAYLMAQSAVRSAPPATQLSFPYNIRPLMAGWNGLFNDAQPYTANTAQSAEWNRGAYLVNGLGHCGACHTPRNALGTEKGGQAFLSGAVIDGWEAPALTALSRAPVPWSADELYSYLRKGYTSQHGIAAGAMGPVVQQLANVPDADIRAMATYLASFNEPGSASLTAAESAERARQVVLTAQKSASQLLGPGQRLFSGACGSCHHDGKGPTLLGVNPPLALNSNLHSERPDNLIRV
ncbi:MAG: molybdopterin-dependent oxidoreductase, partial [Polaromonas sp.]|nr:molybdopterin-dependent oxidoreductase [Polaromonas sp.]